MVFASVRTWKKETPRLRRRFEETAGVETALANFSLTFAKALLVFCVVLFMLITPEAKDGTKPNAQFLITVDWMGKYDVDTWIRLPDGNRVNFLNKESGIVFLERDDLGNTCQLTASNSCEEVVVLRGFVPGEYVLALHLYSADGSLAPNPVTPVTATIRIEKLNPTVHVVWQDTAILDRVRQEKRLIRFEVTKDGAILNFTNDALPSLAYGNGL